MRDLYRRSIEVFSPRGERRARRCSASQPSSLPVSQPFGFSLMELMVVLIVMTISMGVILPRVGAGWKQMEDREFLQDFVQTLKRARLIAMNTGEIVAFRIKSAERLYDLAFPPQRVIPENVDIFADHLEQDPETGDHLILFYPDGSLVGNNLEVVFDKGRTFHISIHPLFGTVQVYTVQPR